MTRDELLTLTASDVRAVELGDGRTAHVRALSVADVERAQSLAKSGRVPPLAAWVLLAACDAGGRRLFADSDAEAVARLPVRVARPICEAALALNGLTDDEATTAAAAEGDDPNR